MNRLQGKTALIHGSCARDQVFAIARALRRGRARPHREMPELEAARATASKLGGQRVAADAHRVGLGFRGGDVRRE